MLADEVGALLPADESWSLASQQTAGIRGKALIVNLPDKPGTIRDCLDAVMLDIPYCIDLIERAYLTTDESRIVAFRPKSK